MSEQRVDVSSARPLLDKSETKKKEILRGLKDGLPVLLGVIPFALVLGAQASHKGIKFCRRV